MKQNPEVVDPLDCIPKPVEVRRRLGTVYRQSRLLRKLLKLAERHDEQQSTQPSHRRDDRKSEVTPC